MNDSNAQPHEWTLYDLNGDGRREGEFRHILTKNNSSEEPSMAILATSDQQNEYIIGALGEVPSIQIMDSHLKCSNRTSIASSVHDQNKPRFKDVNQQFAQP